MQRIATLITGILTTSTIITGSILLSTVVFADDSTEDEVSITVPVSCTLSGTGMNTHNAEIANGLYNSAIGETTLKALCNDDEGFAIYAIGYTDNEAGKNVLTNSTLGSTADIVTGTAISGNTSNWAMKLTAISSPTPTYPIIVAGSASDSLKEQGDPDFTTFQEVPDDYKKVAYRTAATDIGTNAEGSSVKTTYQAYISPTQPAGTYTGQVKYTLVHPHDNVAPQIPSVSFEDAFLTANKNKLNGYYKMQDMTNSICDAVTLYDDSSQTQLIDIRDNKVYWVAKLRDDNCWMTQNLNFDLEWGDTLTSDSTDIGWNSLTSNYDSASVIVDEISHEEPEELVWNGVIWSDSTTDVSQVVNATDLHNHLGNYYDWNSAVLANNPRVHEESDVSPEQSVCPAYWTLPSIEDYNQLFPFYYSDYDFGTSNMDAIISFTGSPIYFIPSINDYVYSEIGHNGKYWSKTVYGTSDESFSVELLLDQETMYSHSSTRTYKGNIHCLAR